MRKFKKNSKKVLSAVLALAVVLCSVTVSLSVFANTQPQDAVEPYKVSWRVPAIPLYEYSTLDLSTVDVELTEGGDYTEGSGITWAMPTEDDGALLNEDGKTLYVKEPGTYRLTANGNNVWVVVAERNATEFYLERLNFVESADNAATNLSNWRYAMADEIQGGIKNTAGLKSFVTDKANNYENTKFLANTFQPGYNAAAQQYYVYNSDILKDFADYTVNMSFYPRRTDAAWVRLEETQKASVGVIGRVQLSTSDETKFFEAESSALAVHTHMAGGINIEKIGTTSSVIGGAAYTLHTLENYQLIIPDQLKTAPYTSMNKDMVLYDDSQTDNLRSITAKFQGNSIEFKNGDYTIFDSAKDNKQKISFSQQSDNKIADITSGFANEAYNDWGTASQDIPTGKGSVGFTFARSGFRVNTIDVKLNDDIKVPSQAVELYVAEDSAPAIPAFVNTEIDLNSVVVEFKDGTVLSGAELTWTADPGQDGIIVSGTSLIPVKTDIFKLTATKGELSRTVYLIVNEKNDYKFKIIEENLTGTTYDAKNWVFGSYGIGNNFPNAGSFVNRSALPSDYNLSNGVGQSNTSWGPARVYMYTSDILAQFSDYTVEAQVTNQTSEAEVYRQFMSIYLRADVDMASTTNVFTASKQFGFLIPATGGVMPSASSSGGISYASGSSNTTLHTLADSNYLKETTSDVSYVWSNSTHTNIPFDNENAKQQPRDIKIVLDGSHVVYSLDNHEIFDSAKSIKTLGAIYANASDQSLTPTTEGTLKNSDFEKFMTDNGLVKKGNGFGFAVGRSGAVMNNFTISLNFKEGDVMPAYTDVFTLSEDTPFIPMTEGTVLAADFLFTTSAGKVDAIGNYAWVSDKEGVSYSAETGFTATKPGVYTLTAGTETLYIVVKGVNDTDYTVFSADYRNAGATISDTWTTYITNGTSTQVYTLNDGITNQSAAGNGGFQPYTKAQMAAKVGEIIGEHSDWEFLTMVTVLENDLIDKLNNYRINATVYMQQENRSSFGIAGRINASSDSVALSGFSIAGRGAWEAWWGKAVFNNSANSTRSNSETIPEWFYSTSCPTSAEPTLRLKEFSLDFNGTNMNYYSTGATTLTNEVTDVAGGAGFVQLGRRFNTDYAEVAGEIIIYDYTVTVPAGAISTDGLTVTQIQGHTPYVANSTYAVIPSSDADVNNDADATRIDKITYNGTNIVDVRIPATVDGTAITKLGSLQEGWSASAAMNAGVLSGYAIRNVYIDNAVTLGAGALAKSNAEKIVFPTTEKSVTVEGLAAAIDSKKLLRVENLAALKTFGYQQMFQAAYSLAEVEVPAHMTSIAAQTFDNAFSLGIVKLNDGLKEIKDKAFAYNHSLHDINLPSTLTTIGKDVFRDCYSLKSIEIPESVATIGDGAFAADSNLKEVTIYSPNVTIAGPETSSNWAFDTTGMTIKGYKGSTAEAYVTAYNTAYPDANIIFEALDANVALEASQNSVIDLPAKFAGLDVTWSVTEGDNAAISADKTKLAVYGAANDTVTLTGICTDSAVAPTLTITVTAFDENADNFVNGDAPVTANGNGSYTITLSGNIDYSQLKIDGKYDFDVDSTGTKFTFTAASLPDVKIEYAAETKAENYFYNLGGSVKIETNGLRFVTRSTAITNEDFLASVKVNGGDVKPVLIGAMVAPQAIATPDELVLTPEQIQTLVDNNDAKVDIVVEERNNKQYTAQHLAIKILADTTDKFGDYNVVLNNVPANQQSQKMVYRTYMIYQNADETYSIIYSDVVARSYSEVATAIAQ